MQSIPLFLTKKDFLVFLGGVVTLFCLSLGVEYYHYIQLISELTTSHKATVLNHYQKVNEKGRHYDVVKLRLDGHNSDVYTVSWKPLTLSFQSRVKVKLKVEKLRFIDYLQGFYATSLALYTIYEDNPPWNPMALYQWVEHQHSEPLMQELYKTLLFATPISKELREDVQKWGISHLIAISGYNVGVISFLLFFLFKPIYQWFQSRYFPYRNAMFDLTLLVIGVLIGYMVVIDFVPSFVRAVVMSFVGFFLFSRGIKLASFELLALCVVLILAWMPTLLFSLSLWFSVAGVFYLFLWLHHFSTLPKWKLLIGIDLGIFFLMIPIVHSFFSVFTWLQLSTPITSAIFLLFYPLSVVLHLLGIGNIFDEAIILFLNVSTPQYTLSFSAWFLVCYIGLSLMAIRYKACLWLCLAMGVGSIAFIQ